MSDPTPDSNRYRSAAGRARTRSPWLLRYKFPQLRLPAPRTTERTLTREEITWSVRGEPRTRGHFADPHPGDFPGGLPLPPDYPKLFPVILKYRSKYTRVGFVGGQAEAPRFAE